MNLDKLVVQEAIRHIKDYHCVRNMDPMALHILKTSDKPLVSGFRDWMRWKAVKQATEAEREQKHMNDEFAHTEYARRSPIRRRAVIHPYYAAKAAQQGDSWNDSKFVGRIQRDNPKCFPQRESR